MILDGENVFSNSQAFTSTATHVSDFNVRNPIGKDVWGAAKNQDPGEGGRVFLHVRVGTAFTSISGLTSILTIALQDSPSTTAGSFSSLLTLASSKKTATLVLGKEYIVGLPADCNNYLRMTYTVATQVFSAGAIEAWLSLDPSEKKAVYP